MSRSVLRSLLCPALLATLALSAPAAENPWAIFRGPAGQGSDPSSKPPVKWSQNDNLAWKVAMPGPGASCPIVWGDRDVQTWRPPTVPASYHGLVLDLPDANHLLKRETRPRGELNGATAMTAYGDKTPMADLTPVAEWLKTLK